MSDSSPAHSLLRGVQGHTLSELLTSVFHDTSPLGSTLVPVLDIHLDETNPTAACKRGDVIELQGPAASGKTHFLYHMLINCVLPSSYSSTKLSGWGKAAIFFDTDHKFDVQRFTRLLSSRVKRLLPLNLSAVEAITTKSLDLLHVFRPTSSHQLAATIQYLPMYLATNLPEADLGILAIDSITSFYWPNRYLLEQIRFGNSSRTSTRSHNPLNHVLTSTRSLAQSHGPLILLSSWDLSPPAIQQTRQRFDAPTSAPRSSTVKSGQQILPVSHHITLTTSNLFTSNEENMGSRATSFGFITTNTCLSGTVRTPGDSKVTQFTLHITEDDILVP